MSHPVLRKLTNNSPKKNCTYITVLRQLDKLTKSGPSAALFSTSPHAVTPGQQPPNEDNSESKG